MEMSARLHMQAGPRRPACLAVCAIAESCDRWHALHADARHAACPSPTPPTPRLQAPPDPIMNITEQWKADPGAVWPQGRCLLAEWCRCSIMRACRSLACTPHAPLALLQRGRPAADQKLNLGVGAYRNEKGQPHVLSAVRKATHRLASDPAFNKVCACSTRRPAAPPATAGPSRAPAVLHQQPRTEACDCVAERHPCVLSRCCLAPHPTCRLACAGILAGGGQRGVLPPQLRAGVWGGLPGGAGGAHRHGADAVRHRCAQPAVPPRPRRPDHPLAAC